MSGEIDLSQLGRGFKAAEPAPAPTFEDMAAAMLGIEEERRREHRTVYCAAELVDEARAVIAAAGLSGWVDVAPCEFVEGQLVIARTPLDEHGEPAGWAL